MKRGMVCLSAAFTVALGCHAVMAEEAGLSSAYQGGIVETYDVSPHRPAGRTKGGADILLIQTADPWERSNHIVGNTPDDGITSDTMVLDQLGKSYEVATWTQIDNGSADVFGYQVVLIVNDQVQQFYDDYAAKRSLFEQYVQNGGTLIFFAAGDGWAGGSLNAPLPGGVSWTTDFKNYNEIVTATHPIITAILSDSVALLNDDLYSNYASHGHFGNLVAGTTTVLRNTDGQPTLIEYKIGSGTVIASTLTWEHNWSYHTGGDSYGTFARKALDDVFLYAFSKAGGYQPGKLIVDVYPEDSWQPKRPKLWRAQGDLIDIVATPRNLESANIENVELRVEVDATLVESGFLKVYERDSADHIAIQMPTELVEGTHYTDNHANTGTRIITLTGLELEPESVIEPNNEWNDFVFRFQLRNPLASGTEIDAEAVVNAPGYIEASEKLSDGGEIEVIPDGGAIIITSREAIYKHYAGNGGTINWGVRDQIHQLWEALYRIAADRQAVIYHVDEYEYVENDDHSATDDIIRNWPEHRDNLENGGSNASGNYHYDSDVTTGNEEDDINQVANKVDGLLHGWIANSGGIPSEGRYVLILGGDGIVPFYRAFCPGRFIRDDSWTELLSGAQKDFHPYHSATDVTEEDADNNYLFTDIVFTDYNGLDWITGSVEDIYCGRIAGPSPSALCRLLSSSSAGPRGSANAIKAENRMRDGELDAYQSQAVAAGYSVVTEIDGVTLDLGKTLLNSCEDDPAQTEHYLELFTNTSFEVFRMMAHGSVYSVSSSEKDELLCWDPNYLSHAYLVAWQIREQREQILANLGNYNPLMVFDNCLVGLVDGQSEFNFFNALSGVGIGSALQSSCITFTPNCSDHNDLFTKALFDGRSIGSAKNNAAREYSVNALFDYIPLVIKLNANGADMKNYTRLQMNLFGVPWTRLDIPKKGKRGGGVIAADFGPNVVHDRVNKTKGSFTQEIDVDCSQFDRRAVDGFEIVDVAGFGHIKVDGVPVLPSATYSILLPLDATISGVEVNYGGDLALGAIEIPAFATPAPLDGAPGDYAGSSYVTCPNGLGTVPTAPQFSQHSYNEAGRKVVAVSLYPVRYDTGARTATLMQSATIRVQYESEAVGTVVSFQSDADTYGPGQNILTGTEIRNTSESQHDFDVTLEVQDTAGNVVATANNSATIASGNASQIDVDLAAPATPGTYKVVMYAADDQVKGSIGGQSKFIQVVSGLIMGFEVPNSFTPDQPGTLSVTFQNISQDEILAEADIAIMKVGGGQVADLPQFTRTVPAMATETLETSWIPPADIEFGTYYASVVVNAGGLKVGPTVEYFTMIQDPDNCTYSISPTNRNHTSDAGSGSITVTAASGCAWTTAESLSWVSITSGASGSGNGTVSYSVDANPAGSPARSGVITVAGQSFMVSQDPAPCSYSISPTNCNHTSDAGSGSITVMAASGCAWTATESLSWITITGGSSGSGTGTVTYSVAANSGTSARTGTIVVAGGGLSQTCTVTQAGTSSSITVISPNGGETLYAGGTHMIRWNSTGINGLVNLEIYDPLQSMGWAYRTISYSEPNDGEYQWTIPTDLINGSQFKIHLYYASGGMIQVWDESDAGFTITNIPTMLSVAPASVTHSSASATGRQIEVTANVAWTAARGANSTWITITSGSSGSGNGAVTYSVAANSGTSSRTGAIVVAGGGLSRTCAVTQAGASGQTGYLPSGAWELPGRIEFENVDIGGEGVAFHDTTTANEGDPGFRNVGGVDFIVDASLGNGHGVGWTQPGEWLEYTVNVATSGTYGLNVRLAADGAGGQFRVRVDGADKTGVVAAPNTGSWNSYQVISLPTMNLSSGIHIVRVEMVAAGPGGMVGNFDWMEFGPPPAPVQQMAYPTGVPWLVPGRIEFENVDIGGEEVAYHDTTAANEGGAYRGIGVDIKAVAELGNGHAVGWTQPGEWLEYTVHVSETADYRLFGRMAASYAGAQIRVRVMGTPISQLFTLPKTGSWFVYQTANLGCLELTSGIQTVRVEMVTAGASGYVANLDWMEFVEQLPMSMGPMAGDYDRDEIADPAVFRPSGGQWRVDQSAGEIWNTAFGWSDVKPVPADYDGDGKTDLAVYYPAGGMWYFRYSSQGEDEEDSSESFGWSSTVPVPGDYDGDGRADLAVFYQTTATWYFRYSSQGEEEEDSSVAFGWPAVIPVPADYDGDGVTDLAVYHPASGNWYCHHSSAGIVDVVPWGWSAAVPVPADYDGDGAADIAVFYRATGTWYIQFSGGGDWVQPWGWPAVVPVAADYDGDGQADLAVYHPAGGQIYIRRSTTGASDIRALGGTGWMSVLLYPLIHSWFSLP